MRTPPLAGFSGPARRLKQVAVGVVSALIVATAVLYVAAPSRPSLELSVTSVAGPQPYDYVAEADYYLAGDRVAPPRRRYRETIYGSVTSAMPVARATLVITGVGPRVGRVRAVVRLRPKGAYRARVRLVPGRYRFTIRLHVAGKDKAVHTRVRVRPHHAYRASVSVHDKGIVTMLPISSY
jgi:hypothetical protein